MHEKKFTRFCQVLKKIYAKENVFLFLRLMVYMCTAECVACSALHIFICDLVAHVVKKCHVHTHRSGCKCLLSLFPLFPTAVHLSSVHWLSLLKRFGRTLVLHVYLKLMLDSGAEGPGFKSQSRRCRVTVLGKLLTPIVPLFTEQQNW